MDYAIYPRVNGHDILSNKYPGRFVLFLGELVGNTQDGRNSYLVKGCDGKQVSIYLPIGESFESRFAFVVGKVSNPGVMEGMRIIGAGDDFDVNTYSQAIELCSGKYKELFM